MSKKLKYKVWSNDELVYIIKVIDCKEGIHYKMYRPNNSQLTRTSKSELIEHWFDNGNCIEGLNVNINHTDYDKLDRLKLMLGFIHKYEKNLFTKYKIKKEPS